MRADADRIGVDTGGTFTDFARLEAGRLETVKVPSTPRAPDRAVLEGLERMPGSADRAVRHGSTVATNALLERKGARVTFVTTAGFEDLIEIGRQDRPDIHAIAPRRAPPLVPRERRIGARERLDSSGEPIIALTRAELARLRRVVARTRPEAIAVGLLHSYANPAHERAIGRALASLGLPITLSSDLCPEIREYERFATTVANAFLLPRVARYLGRLAERAGAGLEIVESHGGTTPVAHAAHQPVRQLLSGPAAGVRAGWEVARDCGFRAALTLDVGGTSTDCAHVEGSLPRSRSRQVAGQPIQVPMLDIHTIGAGGGSIARVDRGGLLHVGPESAGADPGPACYGRGGPPTVTDALVVLGRIPGDTLAGGSFLIDRAAAGKALLELARALGHRDPLRAALGVVTLAEAHMAAALRRVSIERGHDPRRAALVCFGGAGGLHACALAGPLGSSAVFPRHAGVLSALGALISGSRRERSRSVLLDARDWRAIDRDLVALEQQVRSAFSRAERTRIRIERRAELRYRGQSHELSVEVGADLAGRFHREHALRYGFADPEAPVEVVTLDVRGALPDRRLPRPPRRAGASRAVGRARAHDGRAWRTVPVWRMDDLGPGFGARGPGIVIEDGATLWIATGWRARRHSSGALVLASSRGRA
jgi:N-methylhydantoinase A